MSKKADASKRKFPWPKWAREVRIRWSTKPPHRKEIRRTPFDPQAAFLLCAAVGLPFLLLGICFLFGSANTGATVTSLLFGSIFCAIGLYAFLSHREELRQEKENQAAREEKQRQWRENRKSSRKKHKKYGSRRK